MGVVRADERWLKRLANEVGIERAIEVLREARWEELVATYGRERLSTQSFVSVALSHEDRKIVFDFGRQRGPHGDGRGTGGAPGGT